MYSLLDLFCKVHGGCWYLVLFQCLPGFIIRVMLTLYNELEVVVLFLLKYLVEFPREDFGPGIFFFFLVKFLTIDPTSGIGLLRLSVSFGVSVNKFD